MPTLTDLDAGAPELARFLRDKVEATGLCFLATTRADGWPRVSPIELFVVDERLYVGSMPDAVKAQDLRRDARCCVATPLADKDDLGGEAKVFCRAREVGAGEEWDRVRTWFEAERGLDLGPHGTSHLFELVPEAAAYQRLEGEDEWRTTSWSPVGRRERRRRGALGASEDLPI